MKTPKEGQVYEHFKRGSLYQIICVAEDVETLDLYVVYKQIPKEEGQEIDTRPWTTIIKKFMEEVEYEGKMVQKFKKVE